ncbi:F0F1 ATP synthase subunit epsilon [Candidatus Sumerlaeota bacterium]|nr:F0F1 ATP synthase subunit epsilon [Candidatus Sumerlaeota bacterium]
MSVFHLQIVSPQRVEFDGEVESLVAPGEEGYVGVLANHAPLLTTLGKGNLSAREASGEEIQCRIEGAGFLEVYDNNAVVLAERIEILSAGGSSRL